MPSGQYDRSIYHDNKENILKRFNSKYKINTETQCWEWTAAIDKKGYGQFAFKRSMKGAHKVSYILHIGEVEKGLYVCHHCDNPKCVNPEHLFLGTQQDNMDDMYNKGRAKRMSCPSFSMYTIGKCRCDGCVEAYRKYQEEYVKRTGKEVFKERHRQKYLKNRDKKLEYAKQQRLKAKEAKIALSNILH